jgi:V/A-type H+-transporting ATPase subunit K
MVDIGSGLVAIGAGLAAGWAEKDIGSAAVGAIAENPKNFGRSLVMTVIPETIVIFGLVIAFLLMGNM